MAVETRVPTSGALQSDARAWCEQQQGESEEWWRLLVLVGWKNGCRMGRVFGDRHVFLASGLRFARVLLLVAGFWGLGLGGK